jgi:hypothetical protein
MASITSGKALRRGTERMSDEDDVFPATVEIVKGIQEIIKKGDKAVKDHWDRWNHIVESLGSCPRCYGSCKCKEKE